ncbi:MAG: hypothetical protein HXY41_10270, partial [Chloroflexi bacterium]|nr:hypothetical protein [Chloroflexota bacterium]
MPKSRLHIAIILCLFALFAAQVFAQDTPPGDAPEATADAEPTFTLIPTAIPTEAPTEAPTSIPTDVLTDVPTSTPVIEATVEVTAEMTVEPPAPETPLPPTPTLVEPALPAEPVLALLAREMFDSGDLSAWVLGGGWSLTANASGLGLQLIGAPDVLQFQRGPFYNAAAQADFLLSGGSVHLSLRQSAVGSYTAALDAAGLVTLYRAGVPVLSAPVLVPPDQWSTLRLSVMDGILRVTVNDVELLAWPDTAPLPPCFAGIAAFPAADGAPFMAQVDNFFLWVPETDLALYPPPTPVPPTIEPVQPTQPPVIVTDEPAPEVTVEAPPTLEPTFEPTATIPPTEAPVGPTGKSLVAQPYAPPPGVAPAAANPPGDATIINTIPYTDTDTTTGADAAGEPAPSCAFNVLATVWYRFTPPAAGKYTFFTAGSSFDTVLAAYTSYSPAAELACSDDVSTKDLSSRLTLTFTDQDVLAGKTIWIQLGGYNAAHGSYTFNAQLATVPAPRPPALTAPANRLLTNIPAQIFTWTAPTGGEPPFRYQIQIDDDSKFGSPLHDEYINGLSYNATLLDGTYYWRVRSLNVNNVGSAWTSARSLTVDTLPPDAPTLTTPANGSPVNTPRPKLVWKAPPGGKTYTLEVRDDTDTVILSTSTTATSLSLAASLLPAPLQHGRQYTWRV